MMSWLMRFWRRFAVSVMSGLLRLQTPWFTSRRPLRGGLWTRAHIGVPIDSVRSYAATAEAIDWVQSCGLPKTTTLSYNKYGEQWAQQLCMYWARTLEHFFDAFSLCGRLV